MSVSREKLISTNEAAKLYGYHYSYLSRLCKKGAIDATLIGGSWMIDRASLERFVSGKNEVKKARAASLSEERKKEYETKTHAGEDKLEHQSPNSHLPDTRPFVHAYTHAFGSLAFVLALVGTGALTLLAPISPVGSVLGAATESAQQVSQVILKTHRAFTNDVARDVRRAVLSIGEVTHLASSPRNELLAASVAADEDSLNVGEEAALFTYDTINDFFASGARYLASLLGPRTIVITPQPIITNQIVSAPATNTTATRYAVVAPTQTTITKTPVTNYFFQGVTPAYVDLRIGQLLGVFLDRQSDNDNEGSGGGGTGNGSVTSVAIDGGSTGLSFAGGPITSSGTFTLSGTLGIASGGTGLVSYTPGDILYADSGGNLARLPVGSSGQVLKISGGYPAWGSDLLGSGGAGAWATTSDSLAVYPADTTNVVIIGSSATSTTGNIFEVVGSSLLRGTVTAYNTITGPRFVATSTTASTFPYASTTGVSSSYASSTNLFAGNFTLGSASGFLKATAGVVSATAISLASDISGILPVGNGGTGWAAIESGAIPYGNGSSALSTTSAGTNGYVLALSGGVPTWVATSSINNGVFSIQQTGGGSAQTGAITFATSSATSNGQTVGFNITNSSGAFTFTPTLSGTLTVAGGGTGQTSFTSGNLLYGAGTGGVQNVATTSFATSGEFSYSGTLGALVGGANGTLSLTTNGVGLTKLAQIAANSILGNNTGSTGNVVAFATSSLGIALSDTTGTLAVNRGGTGTATTPSYGELLVGNGSGGYTLMSTSSLNITGSGGSGTPGGSDTQVQFNDGGSFGGDAGFTYNKTADRITATYASTTGLSSSYASSTNAFFGNLSVGSLSGFLKATAGVVSTALVNLAADVTGVLPVGNGGTGWAAIQSGAIPYGNGTSALSTTTAGTNGQ
ncbi:MAG: hypothetical protein ABA06_04125, partial [Parcubacteria bacterium C7867-001]